MPTPENTEIEGNQHFHSPIAGVPAITIHSKSGHTGPLIQYIDPAGADVVLGAINVKERGAKGDGTTDDTAAIATAIAAIPAGGRLYFPPGTYNATISVTSKSNFTILGDGATITGATDATSIITLTSCTSFEIAGLNIRHTTAAARNSTGYGIKLVSCTDGVIRGNLVFNTCAAGIFDQTGTRISITNNTVRDNLADGIHTTGASKYVTITGNRTHTTGDDGISTVSYLTDGAACSDITITGNVVFQAKARGISCVGGDGVTIVGNTTDSTTGAGVYLAREAGFSTYGVLNATVSGNTIKAANSYNSPGFTHAAIHVSGDSATYTVDGVHVGSNHIITPSWRMIQVAGGTTGAVKNISLLCNTLNGPNVASAGIECDRVNGVAIIGNNIRYAFTSGIWCDANCTDAHVGYNNIYYPNQANGGGAYGVRNLSPSGRTPGNIVTADAGKASLSASVASTDQAGISATYGQLNFLTAGAVNVPSGQTDLIPPAYVAIRSTDTATLVKVRYRIDAGTSVTFKLQKNGSDITGATGLSATTSGGTTTLGTAATLADGDLISVVVTAVSGSPTNLTVAAVVERIAS
jgi:hypothetical protein